MPLLLVAMPLLLVASMLLVVRPGAPSSPLMLFSGLFSGCGQGLAVSQGQVVRACERCVCTFQKRPERESAPACSLASRI